MTVWKSKIYLQIPSNPFPSIVENIQIKFIKSSPFSFIYSLHHPFIQTHYKREEEWFDDNLLKKMI